MEKPVKKIKRGHFVSKEIDYRAAFLVTLGILFICVLFSAFQSAYIFRLNCGREGIMSYADILNRARKEEETGAIESVVNEETAEPTELPEPWFSLEEAAFIDSGDKKRLSTVEIANKVSPATVSIAVTCVDDGKESKLGSGTGFIIDPEGYIVTNQHVVAEAEGKESTYYVYVQLSDAPSPVRAEIVGCDEQTDIAVLKIESDKELPCVTLGDSDTLQSGEIAIAIGNALGTLSNTVTVGIISAPSREMIVDSHYVEIIQTDAAINPGNSGGPLINSFGEVVGITSQKIVSSTSENLGFAIPINSVKKVIEDLINYGKVINRPYLGISVKYVANDSYYGAKGGVYIAEIVKDGPGDVAGLKLGDRILYMDGVEITQSGDIINVRDSHMVGDTVDIVVEREGSQITLQFTIGDSADY